ncbi:MAG TPA: hypothetical protein PLX08_07870 [Bacteroidales bacterium]|nr:hypothetical protein [Bacteroidales bacterium]
MERLNLRRIMMTGSAEGGQEGGWLIYQPEFLFPGIQKDNIFYA